MRSLFIALFVLFPGVATAQSSQQGGNIDLQAFRPAMDSRGFITVNASQVLGHRQLSFGLVTNWGRNVLRFESGEDTYEVSNVLSPTLVGAYGLRLGKLELELGVSVPFSLVSGDRSPDDDGGTQPPNDDRNFQFEGQGLGNIGAHAKVRLLNTSKGARVGLAVVASVYLPTATEDSAWLGDEQTTPQAMIVVDRELAGGRVRAAANLGVRFRSKQASFTDDAGMRMMDMSMPSTGESIRVGSTIPFGVGIAYAISRQKLELVGEVFGEAPLSGENYFPLEAITGLKVYLASNSFLTFGGGVGLLDSVGGNPDVRAFIGIVFEPNIGDRDGDGLKDDVDRCPDDPEDFDDFEDQDGCPELDNDLDQILDVDDRCPNVPEDRDGVEDDDGCPETDRTDRDGDRIPDDVDDCPDDPEDYDDFEDENGCPDLDNDDDQLLDVVDLCPNDPEDHDDFEDEDGCPDPDNDRDRILDTDDACPNEPETRNGYRDEDGCPDKAPVTDVGGELMLLDKIHFEYNKAIIKEESFPILDAVGYTIEHNPDIKLVEVQGHTDERGSKAYNLDLSQRRAEAVVAYLEKYGVETSHLYAQGYGESDPIETGHNEEAWAVNRRVQFIVEKRD